MSSLGISYIVIGTIGGIFNIILFTRRSLRSASPCIPYMLAANVANMINLYSYITLRTLAGFNITFVYYVPAACKLQFYMFYTSVCISTWFMVACCVDRFLSSSRDVRIRGYSSVRIAHRTILIMIIVTVCICSEVFYCFDANQINAPGPCYTVNNVCRIYDTVFSFVFQIIGPSICMVIFGIGTFNHIRQGRQIQPTQVSTQIVRVSNTKNADDTENIRSRDRSILRMLITQILLYMVCTMPLFIFKLYSALPLTIVKSDVRIAAESVILNIAIFLQLVDKTFAFFIYTMSSKYFRQEFLKLITFRNR